MLPTYQHNLQNSSRVDFSPACEKFEHVAVYISASRSMSSRLLSASKICLLALIRVYREGYVPGSAISSVLVFIASHIQPEIGRAKDVVKGGELDVAELVLGRLDAFEPVLACISLNFKNEDGNSSTCTLWDLFLSFLRSIHELDTMTTIVSDIDDYFSAADTDAGRGPSGEYLLSATSPIGLFVRRAKIDLELLRFPEILQLWHEFSRYVDLVPEARAKQRRSFVEHAIAQPDSSQSATGEVGGCDWAVEMIASTPSTRRDLGLLVSTHDYNRLVEFQIAQMQSEIGHPNVPVNVYANGCQNMEPHFPWS